MRLMRLMGLEALYPRPRTSRAGLGHKVYPYLLRGLTVERPNEVWAADICYLPMARGFLYLVAVMDWFSRKVLAWRLSNASTATSASRRLRTRSHTLGVHRYSTPTRAHSSPARRSSTCSRARASPSARTARDVGWTTCSWNGCGEVLKYEEVYLHACEGVAAARAGLGRYFRFYNAERRHQGLGRRTPDAVYADSGSWPKAA